MLRLAVNATHCFRKQMHASLFMSSSHGKPKSCMCTSHLYADNWMCKLQKEVYFEVVSADEGCLVPHKSQVTMHSFSKP